eukprot:3951619-Heterocapsa_arctica.AAC.1
MSGMEADAIRNWYPTLDKDSAAHMVRLLDNNFFKIEEGVHTALEQAIQKCLFDAIANGYHGRAEEKKTPGYAFNLTKFARFGLVPHGAIFDSLIRIWGDARTETMFWNIILHTKNDREHYNSYMIKYWPKMNL